MISFFLKEIRTTLLEGDYHYHRVNAAVVGTRRQSRLLRKLCGFIVYFKTIYNWIYNGSLHGVNTQVLRHSRGASKGCLATFVERKSRLYTVL